MTDKASLRAGGLLCRASLLASRAEGGHPIHLWLAKECARRAASVAPNDAAIALFAARVAIETGEFSIAERLLEPFTKGRDSVREAIALKGFLVEIQGDRERARATYLHLRVLRAEELSKDAVKRLDEHPALYRPPSEELLPYSQGSPADPITQLAFLRAAAKPALLQKMAEAALPYVPPAPMEVTALIEELRRRVIRWNTARLLSTALSLSSAQEEALQVAEALCKDSIEDRARAGGAVLCRKGRGEQAAKLLFENEAVSADARAWALAFAPEAARPYLGRLPASLEGTEIRFLRGVPALLGSLGEEGGAMLLARIQASDAPYKALEANAWLLRSGHPEGPSLMSSLYLERGIPALRRDGYEEIGRMGGALWVERIEEKLHYEPDPEVRQEAMLALFSLADFSLEVVERALSFIEEYDSDTELRGLASMLLRGKRVVR